MSETHGGLGPAAGWYPDPQMAHTVRYWDGAAWTDHRAPAAPAATVPATPTYPGGYGGYVTSPGYAAAGEPEPGSGVAALGYVMAVLLPIVGLIIGLTQINKRHGAGIIATSVIAFVFWAAVFSL